VIEFVNVCASVSVNVCVSECVSVWVCGCVCVSVAGSYTRLLKDNSRRSSVQFRCIFYSEALLLILTIILKKVNTIMSIMYLSLWA